MYYLLLGLPTISSSLMLIKYFLIGGKKAINWKSKKIRPLIKVFKQLDQQVKDNVTQALWHGSTGPFLLQPWMRKIQVMYTYN